MNKKNNKDNKEYNLDDYEFIEDENEIKKASNLDDNKKTNKTELENDSNISEKKQKEEYFYKEDNYLENERRESPSEEKANKRKSRIFKILFLVISIGIFIASLSIGQYLFNRLYEGTTLSSTSAQTITNENKNEEEKAPENKSFNFLVLGVDKRLDDVGRSDTIIVLSVNMATKKVGLISVPRDSYVEIPSHGHTKINHSYAYGGALLTKAMVENTLGLKIDNYIVFNFRAFKNIIEALGGVDLTVEKDMYYRDDWDGEDGLVIDLKAGKQHLDGDKAIQYVRYRDEEGDIGRVKRQQNFLNAVMDKLTSPTIIAKIPSIIKETFKSVETDIKFDNITEYLSYLRPYQKYTIESIMVPGYPDMIDDISYWIIDKDILQASLYNLDEFVNNNKNTENSSNNGKDFIVAENMKDADKKDENLGDLIDATDSSEKKNRKASIFRGSENESKSSLDWQMEMIDKSIVEKAERARKEDEAREKLLAEERRRELQAYLEEQERNKYRVNYSKANKEAVSDGVRIINTTDDIDKTEYAARALESRGININMVNNRKDSGNSNQKTIFIVSEKDDKIMSVINSMPFKFTVMYKANAEISTLIIGNDFYK